MRTASWSCTAVSCASRAPTKSFWRGAGSTRASTSSSTRGSARVWRRTATAGMALRLMAALPMRLRHPSSLQPVPAESRPLRNDRRGMTGTFERELDLATRVAREAGILLKSNFGKTQDVQYKGRIDLVTEMDHRSEELILGRLGDAFPGDGFLAEERGRDSSTSDRVWIIDPLDGTVNYAHEYPVFCVSIALQVAGELVVGAVYNPLLDEMYAARRGGGATLNGQQRRVTKVDKLEQAMLATGFGYDVGSEPDPEKNNLGPFARFIRV